VDKEGVATMLSALQTTPRDVLPKVGFVLPPSEIARRLGISEEAARGLIKAASQELLVPKK
jgi:hypothetical protein